MNKKIILRLLSTPMLVSSILSMGTMGHQAHAAQTRANNADNADKLICVQNQHIWKPVCARASVLAQIPKDEPGVALAGENNDKLLAFSIEESDMAVTLFNCDCPQCINALRQMRGMTPLVY